MDARNARGMQRWQQWWLKRLPPCDHTTLTHRNLYILPTRPGWMLAITVVLLLVGSINYQLNLGYLLTFLIAGCAVVGMHMAHNNLRGLQFMMQAGEPVFAGQPAPVEVRIQNPSRKHRYGIALNWWETGSRPKRGAKSPAVWADAPARSLETVALAWPTRERGCWTVPPLSVETRFPLGTFRVWHWWRPTTQVWVYPAPETPAPPLSPAANDEEGLVPAQSAGERQDEIDGVRPYRRGDPLKWVVWKKAARQDNDAPDQWVSRSFSRPTAGEVWLNAETCGIHDPEGQRSRLCAWVLQAEDMGLRYGLKVGEARIAPGQGPLHRQRCLEALACH